MFRYQTNRRATLALTGALLAVTVVTAGCGRHGQGSATAAEPAATGAEPAATPTVSAPAAEPTATPVASPTPATSPKPAAAAVPTPDLSGIDDQIDQLGRDLDADASASTSEGSPR
jgi:hypothetical protein